MSPRDQFRQYVVAHSFFAGVRMDGMKRYVCEQRATWTFDTKVAGCQSMGANIGGEGLGTGPCSTGHSTDRNNRVGAGVIASGRV
jgi:hypothetical protein